MLNVLFDFALILVFFIVFKRYDIYVATQVIIVLAFLQAILTRLVTGHFNKKQLIILGVLILFGGMTLYFHNPIFIKWKPTVIFWIVGVVFFLSQFIGAKPLVQRMMTQALEGKSIVPDKVWKRLNIAWSVFFILLGCLNVFVAYYFTTNTWVNFKLYGILGALLGFAVVQSIFLARYITVEK